MALTQRLLIRQSQALVMTPQLMQAIKLLQLSNLDLVAYVEGELERNPLLDQSADDTEPAAEPEAAQPAEPSGPDGEEWGESVPANDAVEHRGGAGLDDAFTDEGHAGGIRGAEGPAAHSQWG